MLLVVDIGNTVTSMGLYQGERWEKICRVKADRAVTPDEVRHLLVDLFPSLAEGEADLEGTVISSVVPHLQWVYETAFRGVFGIEPLLVGPDTDFGLKWGPVKMDQVGVDRLVNSAAAYQIYGGPVIVVDMGTAITFDLVAREGIYWGGVIAPGFFISAEALFNRAAQLREVSIGPPLKVLGATTEECIRSGLFYGTIGGIDEIVRRIAKEAKVHPKVVATGGASTLLARGSTTIEEVIPHLTLEGLKMIYKRAQNSEKRQYLKKRLKNKT